MHVSSDELTQLQQYITVACSGICTVDTNVAYQEGECIHVPSYRVEVRPSTFGVFGGEYKDVVRTWNVIAPSSTGHPILIGPAHRTMQDAAQEVALYIARCRIVAAFDALERSTAQQPDAGAAGYAI